MSDTHRVYQEYAASRREQLLKELRELDQQEKAEALRPASSFHGAGDAPVQQATVQQERRRGAAVEWLRAVAASKQQEAAALLVLATALDHAMQMGVPVEPLLVALRSLRAA